MKKTQLRVVGTSNASILKRDIQEILREIGIVRDGGCVFRDFPETGKCGGYRKDGKLILQFDHLNSRIHAISFSDSRLGILVCKRHHLYFKKQYPVKYEEIARKVIGKERCDLLDKVRADKSPHKVDLKLAIVVLLDELRQLKNET